MKKLMMILNVVAASFLLMACGSTTKTTTEVKDVFLGEPGDTFIVGLDDTFVPMGFRDNKGNLVGLDIDLATEVAKRLKLTIEFQPIDWAMKETELNAGNIDAIWNGYSVTEERKEKVDFSIPYNSGGQIFVVLEDSPIQTWDDLKGKTVAAQQSSSTVDLLINHENGIVDTFANGEIIQYPSYNDVFNDLDSNRSDAIAVSEIYARYTMKQKGAEKYRILDEGFAEEDTAVGVRKTDTAFLKKLNTTLTEMEKDGTLSEIKNKWITE